MKKIAILRGINVGGHRKIRMADLRQLLIDTGYTDVATYIQSGNVVFDADEQDHGVLAGTIATGIRERFGHEVPVVVRSADELEASVRGNPFVMEGADINTLHLVFLKEKPTKVNIARAEGFDFPPDRFAIHGSDVYLCCAGRYHETKLSNQFFEKKLQVDATTRNWKTVLKLLEMSH